MKLRYPNVLPECFVDTNLIQYLLNGTVNHQHCCSKVVGTMQSKFSDRFAIGIIDRDKVELGYITECRELFNTVHLAIWQHSTLPHFLITVAPAIDRFILDCAASCGVCPEDYGLPSDLKEFTIEAKRVTSNKDVRFMNLFAAIRKSPEFVILKNVLKYLLDKNYSSDVNELKEFARLWIAEKE